jgi:hypothetical protein
MNLDSPLVILMHKFILDREPGVDGYERGRIRKRPRSY